MVSAAAALGLPVVAAERLLASAIAGKATPKALGHIAAALLRGCVGPCPDADCDVGEEVSARVALIKPVLHERVAAGAAGRSPRIPGVVRAKRNVATHSLLGQGSDALEQACMSPQRAQRGGRHKKADETKHKDGTDETTNRLQAEEKDREKGDLSAKMDGLNDVLQDPRAKIAGLEFVIVDLVASLKAVQKADEHMKEYSDQPFHEVEKSTLCTTMADPAEKQIRDSNSLTDDAAKANLGCTTVGKDAYLEGLLAEWRREKLSELFGNWLDLMVHSGDD